MLAAMHETVHNTTRCLVQHIDYICQTVLLPPSSRCAEAVLAIKLEPGLLKRNSALRTPLLLAYPKFAWPFDWPTQMKIPRTASADVPTLTI